jgi:CDP-6-deoxy-D-xylo-4-hexulose-3-dehydrase
MLFGGNLIKQLAYSDIKYRAPDAIANTNLVMDNLFWIGVYPGLTEEMIRYVLEKFGEFVSI